MQVKKYQWGSLNGYWNFPFRQFVTLRQSNMLGIVSALLPFLVTVYRSSLPFWLSYHQYLFTIYTDKA